MFKRIMAVVFFVVFLGFQAAAQDADDEKVTVSGDLTTIYTLGNADDTQKIDDPLAAGAYFNDPVTGTRRNGYYTVANLYATFRPFAWMEGYFKLYTISRPGSFHLPLQMENMGRQDFPITLDVIYGRVGVLKALNVDIPFDIFLKAGRYKAQAAQFGIVSKYKTEQILYMMNTKTDFNYELGFTLDSPFKLSASVAVNYLFDESVQRYYDEDGALPHGDPVLNEYAPQFLAGIRLQDFKNISAELLYGQNVSNIYSGNAMGLSARYTIDAADNIKVPIGLQFAYYEKNIDMLGQAAVNAMAPSAGNTTTMDFRDSLGAALGAGIVYNANLFSVEFNLAGTYNLVKHYYRNDLSVIKLSADTMVTFAGNYFIGGGIIMGTLTDVEWKTRDDARGKEDYIHTFTPAENMGYEIYAGINLAQNSKFVIGFNDNKGLSLNNMLEPKTEGQMKYKQKDSNWAQDKLAQAGGLYFKFFLKY